MQDALWIKVFVIVAFLDHFVSLCISAVVKATNSSVIGHKIIWSYDKNLPLGVRLIQQFSQLLFVSDVISHSDEVSMSFCPSLTSFPS